MKEKEILRLQTKIEKMEAAEAKLQNKISTRKTKSTAKKPTIKKTATENS